MATTMLLDPHFQAVNSSGVPLSGGLLYTYATGTTTPVTVYQDSAAATPHANPVVADSTGLFAPIYITSANIKLVLKTSAGVTVQTVDPVIVGGLIGDGTVLLPSIAFASDPDTGIYRIGANNLGVSAAGAKVLDVSATGLGVVGTTLSGDGTVSLPSFGFTSDTNSGFYRIGADNIGLTLGGVVSWNYTASTATFTYTEAGAAVGPVLDLYRNSASPAASDILGNITFSGVDAGAAKQEYASIEATITDTTAGSEDSNLNFYTVVAGARTKVLSLQGSLTANYVLLGNGTSPLQTIAPGTSGNVLTSDGTTWASSSAPPSGGMTLLGTITTTSGASQSLSSLVLTDYKQVMLVFAGVSGSNAAADLTCHGYTYVDFLAADAAGVANGFLTFDLSAGIFQNSVYVTGSAVASANNPPSGDGTLVNASTAVTVAVSAGAFDAGSIRVYGIK